LLSIAWSERRPASTPAAAKRRASNWLTWINVIGSSLSKLSASSTGCRMISYSFIAASVCGSFAPLWREFGGFRR
jgi:hypothetical protein